MQFPTQFYSFCTEQTEQFGALLAKSILEDTALPRFVALYGDLGVGKTAFVRGFTSSIVPEAKVKSPTFALVNEYGAKGENSGNPPVFHFDMYRIDGEDDLYSIGFYDYLERDGICLSEWSENIGYALPGEYISVTIEKCLGDDPDKRLITLKRA